MNIADRRKFVLSEIEKGNIETACKVNKETALLKVRNSKKELCDSSNSNH
jgi:hypothetical protein